MIYLEVSMFTPPNFPFGANELFRAKLYSQTRFVYDPITSTSLASKNNLKHLLSLSGEVKCTEPQKYVLKSSFHDTGTLGSLWYCCGTQSWEHYLALSIHLFFGKTLPFIDINKMPHVNNPLRATGSVWHLEHALHSWTRELLWTHLSRILHHLPCNPAPSGCRL